MVSVDAYRVFIYGIVLRVSTVTEASLSVRFIILVTAYALGIMVNIY